MSSGEPERGRSRVNSALNKVFPSAANAWHSIQPTTKPTRRRLLCPTTLLRQDFWGPRTDAAVLGSCSRLQNRDAATELTVKRGEQFSTSAHAIRKFVKCLIKKNFFVFSFYVRYDRFIDCDILWIPRSRLRPSPRRVEGRARVSGAFSHDSQVYFQQSAAELPPRHTMTQTIRT